MQGIFHDMSKFSPTEFLVGIKYYQGDKSPNSAERLDKGVSYSWLHHKGRNKHHIEYWLDFSLKEGAPIVGMRIPEKYVVEMAFDRIAASRVYQKEAYTDKSAYIYYEKGKSHLVMEEQSQKLLENILQKLADEGEEAMIAYIKTQVLSGNKGIYYKNVKGENKENDR